LYFSVNCLEKSLVLFGFVDKESRTFSVERQNKIAEIKNQLDAV
jgi:hypothetical protein